MAYGRKWVPSRARAREYAEQMKQVDAFCAEHGIQKAASGSCYFTINGVSYRVASHSVEASNRGAYDWTGAKVRDEYHPGGREAGTVCIHASVLRVPEIYADLVAGYELDGRGNRK